MYFSVVLVLCFVFVIKFEGAACFPNRTCEIGWLNDPGSSSCYRFFPAALKWADARNSCVGQNGLLAVVPSNATNHFITKNVTRGLRSWIGLHNKNSSAGWLWSVVDKRARYTNWAPGEPNNFLYPLYSSEECGEIEDVSGKWNDESCDSLRSYVCQKSLGCDANQIGGHQNGSNTSSLSPVGTTLTLDARCRVGYRPKNATTESTCLADGSWSTPDVECEEIFCSDPSNIYLPNGEIIAPSMPYAVGAKIYYQCHIGYMLLGNTISDCRDVDSRLPVGVWDQPPICLKSPECEPGWVSHNNYCYQYVPELMTWHDADARCQALGGGWTRLVAIGSAAENRLVQQLTNGSSTIWIGLHDVPSEGTWKWLDNSSVGYKNFAAGEPNNGWFWEEEDCVEMSIATGEWNDEDCDTLSEFVCEKFVAN